LFESWRIRLAISKKMISRYQDPTELDVFFVVYLLKVILNYKLIQTRPNLK
jgi:hypothetical protein